jgi:hypothetical protein
VIREQSLQISYLTGHVLDLTDRLLHLRELLGCG